MAVTATTVGETPRRIGGTLVIQPLPGIGDVVWHLPHLKSIAAVSPGRKVTLLTKSRSRADEVLAGAPFLEAVLWLDDARHRGPLGGFRLGTDLAPYGFDRVWILHDSARYALAAWRAGIAERIGYGIGWQELFLTSPHVMTSAEKNLTAIEKANRLLHLNSVPKVEAAPSLPEDKAATARLAAEFVHLAEPRVALLLGASERFKQWGGENFGALAERLNRTAGATVFLVGGSAEAAMIAEIGARLGHPAWLVPFVDRPLAEAAALTRLCRAAAGNDTGLLNIAAACGTRSVGLYGGSPPMAEDRRIRTLEPPGGARYGEDRMAAIPVDLVVSALAAILAGE